MIFSRIVQLLSPSLVSGSLVMSLTIFILATNAWIYIDDNKYFYDFLFGSNGIVTALNNVPTDLGGLVGVIFAGTTVYYVLLALAGLFVAVMVYELLVTVGHMRHVFQEVESEAHASGYGQTLAERLPIWGIRLVCCTVWALYWLVFLRVLLPFGIVLLQNGIDSVVAGNVSEGWFSMAMAAALVAVILHLHVICLRLVSLRLRVFSTN